MALPQPQSDKPNHCPHVVKPASVVRKEGTGVFPGWQGGSSILASLCHHAIPQPVYPLCPNASKTTLPLCQSSELRASRTRSDACVLTALRDFSSIRLMMSQGSRCNILRQKIRQTESQDLQKHPKPLSKQGETSKSAEECNALSMQQTD